MQSIQSAFEDREDTMQKAEQTIISLENKIIGV